MKVQSFFTVIILFVIVLFFSSCNKTKSKINCVNDSVMQSATSSQIKSKDIVSSNSSMSTKSNEYNLKNKDNTKVVIFKKESIDEEVKKRIVNVSWKKGCPVSIDDLAYLYITYWGFDEKEYVGEMIVHKKVADEVLDIFKELYNNKYLIEKIKLIDEYNADDNLSMADNNTSCFCYRPISGGTSVSKHGYGIAIDINPLQNPYIKGAIILPPNGKKYVNRSNYEKGMILKDDICYKAFIRRGWKWGGDWKSPKDYQHFEKNLSILK